MIIHIIDDEESLLKPLSFILKERGYQCKTYTNWSSCVPNSGDIVVSDLSGVGKIKEIDNVKVLTMSGFPDKEPDIEKPFTVDMFIKKIEEFTKK